MSIYDDLTVGVAQLTDAIAAIIKSQDNLFAALQVALQNQTPAGAVEAVQAVIDTAKARQQEIVDAIARDTILVP